jgi:hypothetical protein
MKKKKIVTLLLLIIIFFSCKKEEQLPSKIGYFIIINGGGCGINFSGENNTGYYEVGKLPINPNDIKANKKAKITYKEELRASACMMGTSIDIYSIEYL